VAAGKTQANAQRYRERWLKHPNPQASRVVGLRIEVPEDVERRAESAPCFACGVRGGCKHRPWLRIEEMADA
jgi:hypothetical protein